MSKPTTTTAKRLFAVSGNRCAFPKCPNTLVHGEKVTGKICHIKGRKPKAKRYDPQQSEKERHSFGNLIIMCPIHHDVIDNDEITYTVTVLLDYKGQHEAKHAGGQEPVDAIAEALLDVRKLGIRSFMRRAEDLDQKVDVLLDLTPHFNGRSIREAKLWHERIFPEMEKFLQEQTTEDRPYHLYLPTHNCIGFAAGYCLDAKTGVNAIPVQATSGGKIIWEPDLEVQTLPPLWKTTEQELDSKGQDIALILSVTHEATQDAERYVGSALPSGHRIINCMIKPQPSSRAFRDGTHAFRAAEAIIALLQKRSVAERKGTIHIFTAAPVSFLFFLGQMSRVLGKCILYEHDFGDSGSYFPSLAFPR